MFCLSLQLTPCYKYSEKKEEVMDPDTVPSGAKYRYSSLMVGLKKEKSSRQESLMYGKRTCLSSKQCIR